MSAGLQPGTTTYRIAGLERVTREQRQDIRELLGRLDLAGQRIGALEAEAGMPVDEIRREAYADDEPLGPGAGDEDGQGACPGRVGRGTGGRCCVCGLPIPPGLRRTPGDLRAAAGRCPVSGQALRAVPVLPGPAPGYPAIPGPRVPLLDSLYSTRGIYTEFYDPGGQRYGLPTYPFKWAPACYATRRQLRGGGLRPGGQQPVAQVLWKHRGKRRVAYLYLVALALPKRSATPAQWRAIAAALTARMTCPECGTVKPCCIPTSIGYCNDCAAGSTP